MPATLPKNPASFRKTVIFCRGPQLPFACERCQWTLEPSPSCSPLRAACLPQLLHLHPRPKLAPVWCTHLVPAHVCGFQPRCQVGCLILKCDWETSLPTCAPS